MSEISEKAANRAIKMLTIAAEYIEEHWPDAVVKYDGADCDGYCIAEDCKDAADALKQPTGEGEENE